MTYITTATNRTQNRTTTGDVLCYPTIHVQLWTDKHGFPYIILIIIQSVGHNLVSDTSKMCTSSCGYHTKYGIITDSEFLLCMRM